jgi:hypothetical protein
LYYNHFHAGKQEHQEKNPNFIWVAFESMKLRRNQIIGLFLLLLGLPFLTWGNWPTSQTDLVYLEFSPTELALPQKKEYEGSSVSASQGRAALLTVTAFLRQGDEGILILTLVPSVTSIEANFSDIYATHNLVARARIELDGVGLSPDGDVLTPLRPGTPAVFTWQVRALEPGVREGTLWLHLEFVPLEGETEGSARQRILLAAPRFQIDVRSFLGMAGLPARVIGGLLVTIGLVLLLEPYLSAIIINLFKKENTSEESTEN